MVAVARPGTVIPASILLAAVTGVVVAAAGPMVLAALVAAPAVWVGSQIAARAAVAPSVLILPTVAGSLVITQAWVLTDSQPIRAVTTAYLAALAGYALLLPVRTRLSRATAVTVAVFVVLLLLALARGALSGANGSKPSAVIAAVAFVAVFCIALGAARAAETPRDLARVATAIALSPAIFVAVNFVLLAAPISPPEQQSVALGMESTTLQAIGISAERLQMPLAQSINNVGVVAAAGMAAGIVLAVRGGMRLWGSSAAVVCFVGVAAADTRTALLIGLVVALLSMIRPRGRWAAPLAVLLPLSPFIVVWAVGRIGNTIGGVFSASGRDFSTGSNRFLIWERAIDTAKHPGSFDWMENASRILFGYGAGGHIASGAAYRYEFLFRSEEYRLAHTHNVAIQTFLDTGLVGLLALSAVAYAGVVGLSKLSALPSKAGTALLALLVVLLGGGITEAVPTYISPEALSVLLMTLAVASVRPKVAA